MDGPKRDSLLKIKRVEFETGNVVLASGIYAVQHSAHHLAEKAALFKDEIFPRCSRCSEAVRFRVIKTFPTLDSGKYLDLRTPINELPVLDEETCETKPA